ncbi:MAG: shikimate kinase [Paracoccaceae bacterium]
MARLLKTIVLVGMMGAGKTVVGGQLATILDAPFVDSDDKIMEAAQRTIPEIFERDGEPFFRDRETEVLRRLVAGTTCVLSTGGGAFMSELNRDIIKEAGVSVWLDVELDVLWERVRQKVNRPLLQSKNSYATLKSIYDARVGTYRLADISVQSRPELSVVNMAEKVLNAVLSRQDLFEEDKTWL